MIEHHHLHQRRSGKGITGQIRFQVGYHTFVGCANQLNRSGAVARARIQLPRASCLFGTITFPAAPVAGTYASSNGNAFVLASTQIQLADAVTNADWSASTGQGSFTLVLTSVSLLGTDPDIGTIYLPKGTLDTTLVPITSASG